MARKGQVSIQDNVENDEEFEAYLQAHIHQLICMEVYSEFCGPCLAAGNAIRKGKLEIGQENIAMVKALADNIDALRRDRAAVEGEADRNLSVGAKDEIQLTEEDAKELLYMSDVEPNEACIHALLKGEALLG
ncbi:hypothetical protein MSG28_008439 [Choristoneura fumiferana]|uniref:Uncharacterized protein n=1 Tax=Choristoneura fumiferana TaxID=7141 RepID=A0ACC0J6Q3_CHOFU|nr:hypothetical protein MSG28_008439 [Choristoneura fumiferana]